ncbi:MAG: hypothetical protein HY830_04570 [Actinobacteria bacterium]|nr:hypothetical protein [Actinomycetota bacterium]
MSPSTPPALTPPASTSSADALQPTTARAVARWAVSFVGFPLGGLAAVLATGPVDGAPAALAGGLLTGAVLGVAQGLALRLDRRSLLRWVTATAAGLAVGLTAGASAVGFGTSLGDLAVQGAVSGLAVGAAQSSVLFRPVRPLALVWPVWLAAVWALGWVVTTSVGVQVEDQFTVFGAAGAVTVTLLTAVLPVRLARSANLFAEKSI